MPRETTRYAGMAAVALLWTTLGLAALVSGFPLLGPRPLSWLAADPATAVLYATGLAGGAALLLVFHGYVRAHFPTGRGFSLAMVAGMAGQAVAAVVPIHGSATESTVHTVAALTLGVSLPVLMWRFAAAQPAGAWRQRCRRLAWAEAAACVVGVVLSRLSVAPLAEILPAVCFHAWVVAVTFGPGTAGNTPPWSSVDACSLNHPEAHDARRHRRHADPAEARSSLAIRCRPACPVRHDCADRLRGGGLPGSSRVRRRRPA